MTTKPILAAGLDAGSFQTRCVIGVLEDNRLRFLGYGVKPSKGWSKSRITNQQEATDSILAAVVEAEHMAQVQLESVVAGFGGLSARGANNRGRQDLNRPREIEQKDVARAMERAMRVQLQEDRMILHALPQDFVVDGHAGFHDPRHMTASVLEANAHLVTVSVQEHTSLVGAVNKAHLAVDETVYESLAGSYASVLPEDRREGVVYVDIGAHSTEIICYYGESAQMATTIKVCGDHFSRDLAHALRIPYEAANTVKEEFGSAMEVGTSDNSTVELPVPDGCGRDGVVAPGKEAPRRLINQILESRAVELFEMVRGELTRVGMQRACASGVVLAGAGARLAGICDVAERVLECPARIALVSGFADWPEELNDPAWTCAGGLSMYSARLQSKVDLERQSIGVLGRLLR